jgi:hypothetical protein
LNPAQAEAFLAPFADALARKGNRIGMDVDRKVLTDGYAGSGAAVFPGGRFDFADLHDDRGSTFVEGDLILDAWGNNAGGIVFVRGNLVARALFTTGYLVVAGDLVVERFFGADEQYGTYVLGSAQIESACLTQNHHLDVWGTCTIRELVDDEADGRAALGQRLHAWGVLADPTNVDYMLEAPKKLLDWGKKQGKLPREWADRRSVGANRSARASNAAPKSPAPDAPAAAPEPAAAPQPAAAPEPAARSEVLSALATFLDTTKLSQREQLAALKSDWLPKLAESDRAEAKRLVKKAINSKKLVEERDALLADLG